MKITDVYQKIIYSLIAVISVVLAVYVTIKAGLTSFTHDESFTYLNYVHEPFMDIISYKRAYTNNHILNTVLIKYSEHFFGSSELALRLPSLSACALYLLYTFKLLKRIAPALLLTGFICLVFNSHLIDFFGLARGYGLSFACMLMSIYHLVNYFYSSSRKDLILFNTGAFFAVLSNFSLLNYYVSALIAYNLLKFIDSKLNSNQRDAKYNFFKLNRIHLIAVVVFIVVLYEPIRRISKAGMLDFGGKTGFSEDTFGSIIKGVFYETPLPQAVYYGIQFLLVSLLVLIGLLIIKNIYTKTGSFFHQNRCLTVVYFILLFIIASSYAQHFIIDNDFYTGRFSLFIYPLIMLNYICYMRYLYEKTYKVVAVLLSSGIACFLVINFFININLRFYQDWKYDSETKTAVNTLAKAREAITDMGPIKLGVNWLFEPTVNFYRYTHHLTWLKKADRKGIKPGDTYYYIFSSDTNAYLASGKPVLFSPKGINTLLVRNKK